MKFKERKPKQKDLTPSLSASEEGMTPFQTLDPSQDTTLFALENFLADGNIRQGFVAKEDVPTNWWVMVIPSLEYYVKQYCKKRGFKLRAFFRGISRFIYEKQDDHDLIETIIRDYYKTFGSDEHDTRFYDMELLVAKKKRKYVKTVFYAFIVVPKKEKTNFNRLVMQYDLLKISFFSAFVLYFLKKYKNFDQEKNPHSRFIIQDLE